MMEIKFNVDDKILTFARRIAKVRGLIVFFAILIFAAGLTVMAADTQVPHVFLPGDVISASKINDNFRVLQDKINRLARDVKGVPVGTIVSYAGLDTNVPSGWMLCNGQELKRSEYSELFAVIGTLWGDGNSITTFNLPDLRGLFLRGVNHGRNGALADPDAAERVSNDGSIIGDRVGSYQDDAFIFHSHKVAYDRPAYHATGAWGDYFPSEEGAIVKQTTAEGGKETRPVNAAVNYIIKVE